MADVDLEALEAAVAVIGGGSRPLACGPMPHDRSFMVTSPLILNVAHCYSEGSALGIVASVNAAPALIAELRQHRSRVCDECHYQYFPGPGRVYCRKTRSACSDSGGGCRAWRKREDS